MKKLGLAFLLISVMGYGEITYDDGKIKLDTKMVDGKIVSYDLNNEGKEFNGKIEVDGKYQRGVFFYENGILKKEENYTNISDETPTVITYYDNGQLKGILSFFGDSYRKSDYYPNGATRYWGDLDLNLQENGKVVEKYDNGVIKSVLTYSNGNLDGEYIRFARTGKMIEKGVREGKNIENEIFEDYDILYEDKNQKLGLKVENEVEYVVNLSTDEKFTGKISLQEYDDFIGDYAPSEKEYKNGLLDGKVVTQRSFGVITENYKNGKLNGETITELKSGIKNITVYKNNEIIDSYRKNKEIINFKSPYKYGLTHGEMQIFNDNGKLTMSQEYKFGKENGKRVVYGDNGEVVSEEVYVLGIELKKQSKLKNSLENAILLGSNKIYSYKEVERIKNEVNSEVREKFYKYFRLNMPNDTDIAMAKVHIDNEGKFVRKAHYTVPEIFSEVEVEDRRGYEPLMDFYLVFRDETERDVFREKFFNFINDLNIDDNIGLNLIIMRKNANGEKYDSWLYSNNLGYNLGMFNIESRYLKDSDVFIMRDLMKDEIIERMNLEKKGQE